MINGTVLTVIRNAFLIPTHEEVALLLCKNIMISTKLSIFPTKEIKKICINVYSRMMSVTYKVVCTIFSCKPCIVLCFLSNSVEIPLNSKAQSNN